MSNTSLVKKLNGGKKHDRWSKMEEVAVGAGGVTELSVKALQMLGVDYYKLGLTEKCKRFYMKAYRDEAQQLHEDRVHLNKIPQTLLQVLSHITPVKELHGHVRELFNIGAIASLDDFKRKYPIEQRKMMVSVDGKGALAAMPKQLVKALKAGVDFPSEPRCIQAYYGPFRVRALLYFSVEESERDEYLLSEKERKVAVEGGMDQMQVDDQLIIRFITPDRRTHRIKDIPEEVYEMLQDGEELSIEDVEEYYL